MKKSIIIIEDHSIVRVGIESIIEKSEDFYVMDSFEKGLEGVKQIKLKRPNFAILDLSLPDIEGDVIVKDLFIEKSETKILILSRQKYIPQISHLLTLGIKGYLLKDNASRELIEALKDIDQGKMYISPALKDLLIQVGQVNLDGENSKESRLKNLTERELQVIKPLSQGHNYKEIATSLGISPSTVRVHIRNILAKLNLNDTRDIIKLKDSIF